MAELDAEDRDDLRKDQFAYVDREGGEHLPINDESHVRNAMDRLGARSRAHLVAKVLGDGLTSTEIRRDRQGLFIPTA